MRTTILFLLLTSTLSAMAEELVPRRWSHLPINTSFAGGGYAHTEGDIVFDPVLLAEDVKLDMDSTVFSYIRSFKLLNKTADISLTQAHMDGTWSGLLDGIPTSVRRIGMADPILRFSINLKGAPPLSGKAYQQYRASMTNETIIGVGVSVQLPLGEYKEEKLINLGSNRYTTRFQFGVIHKRQQWTLETTGAVWAYSDNDDFFGGRELEQDPHLFLQGHLTYQHTPRHWSALGIGYSTGSEATIDGVNKDDRKKNLFWALSWGYTLKPRLGIKFAYIGRSTRTSTGMDSHTVAIALSTFW